MKQVGVLTQFVRTHMLEAFDIEPRIEEMIAHFDHLDRAHAIVLKAKAQIGLLRLARPRGPAALRLCLLRHHRRVAPGRAGDHAARANQGAR
jgi:hypothetical protein